jgi:hypothetical protein
VGSTGYPHDEDWIRALGRRSFEHDLFRPCRHLPLA